MHQKAFSISKEEESMKPRTILSILRVSLNVALFATLLTAVAPNVWASSCSGLPTVAQLKAYLSAAPNGIGISSPLGPGTGVGGLFSGKLMWAAVVNRDGEICAYTTSTTDPTQVWPGSQQIAKAKAYTANAFSLDGLALSTARLYTFAQPGHSLFGLNNSNPFNPAFLAQPDWGEGGEKEVAGGIITFGGGVPLYSVTGHIIGGLGVSGDTACTDHEIAKRVRDLAGLNPLGGPLVDDISYSSVDGASVFTHPLCLNTDRNGTFIGNEKPASGY
jgi:uncharacterized protein GlcG (DUF336 family)